ncbi:hypothetical protein PRK78_002918 [Emydomyces testavorans]|uniref:N-acetyltransferase domain-containing protein n=1 Tax=Emydomyces testavorans TaxID=2070801 RepID=A0AAF0DF63_9EURO|nr:hypothetical protein PRK78_002918 [Emydomyces testavorans]
MAQPDSLDHLPQLTTYPATSEDDKIAALRLIADSVAQQRQTAAQSIISHPLCVAAVVLLIAVFGKYQYHGKSLGDLAFVGTTGAGCIMIMLVAVQWMTSGYLEEAARVGTWKWLLGRHKPETGSNAANNDNDDEKEDDGGENVLLVTKYGDEIIGTILLRLPPSTTSSRKDQPPVLVRAWIVKRRYRQKGIGMGLLEETFSFLRARGLNDDENRVDVRFDEAHANSLRVLPAMFNRAFERREKWARKKLEDAKQTHQINRLQS